MIFKLLFKYGTIYREVLVTPKIDICAAVKLLKKDRTMVNKVWSTLADVLEDTAPGAIHECPYKELIINNRTINMDAIPAVLPTGDYKCIFICHNGDDFAGKATIIFSVRSENRDTFG